MGLWIDFLLDTTNNPRSNLRKKKCIVLYKKIKDKDPDNLYKILRKMLRKLNKDFRWEFSGKNTQKDLQRDLRGYQILSKEKPETSEGFEDYCEKINKIFLLGFLIKSSMKFGIESSSQQNLERILNKTLKSYWTNPDAGSIIRSWKRTGIQQNQAEVRGFESHRTKIFSKCEFSQFSWASCIMRLAIYHVIIIFSWIKIK